jgi:GNAT superfamily N-acetyltransferase
MEIRAARPDEAAALSAIAFAAKAHWGYPARWLELWRPALTIAPEFVAAHPVFVVERTADAGGGVAGWSALVPPAPEAGDRREWTLEHLWVLPAEMGRGVGRRLFDAAADHARAAGAATLSIDGDPNALPFYLRVGAVQIGAIRDTLDGAERVRPLLRVAL